MNATPLRLSDGTNTWTVSVDDDGQMVSEMTGGAPETLLLYDFDQKAVQWQLGMDPGGMLTATQATEGAITNRRLLQSPSGKQFWLMIGADEMLRTLSLDLITPDWMRQMPGTMLLDLVGNPTFGWDLRKGAANLLASRSRWRVYSLKEWIQVRKTNDPDFARLMDAAIADDNT